jgi:endoribonuclease Nob1
MIKKEGALCKRIIILDTSAFVAGFDPFLLNECQVTVPKVEKEIKQDSMVKMRFNTAIESGIVKVNVPSKEFQAKTEAVANRAGDSFKLSETDKQLLALALELKESGHRPQIVTDDYSIQNVATQLGIEFVSLATFGIKRLFEWIRYCPACYKQYPADMKSNECQVCGTTLKRKPRKPSK